MQLQHANTTIYSSQYATNGTNPLLAVIQVTSDGGNDSSSARLEVMELPYPAGNVRAVKSKDRPKSVALTWSAGFDGNSRITGYIGQKREVPVSGQGINSVPG